MGKKQRLATQRTDNKAWFPYNAEVTQTDAGEENAVSADSADHRRRLNLLLFSARIYENMEAFNDRLFLELQLFSWLILLRKKRKRKFQRRKHRFWVRDLIKKRKETSQYFTLVQEMRMGDREYFFRQAKVRCCLIQKFVLLQFLYTSNRAKEYNS